MRHAACGVLPRQLLPASGPRADLQAEASDGGVFSVDVGHLLALAIDDGHVQLLSDVRLGQTGPSHRFEEPTEYQEHIAV